MKSGQRCDRDAAQPTQPATDTRGSRRRHSPVMSASSRSLVPMRAISRRQLWRDGDRPRSDDMDRARRSAIGRVLRTATAILIVSMVWSALPGGGAAPVSAQTDSVDPFTLLLTGED